jgi:hypothetical protein
MAPHLWRFYRSGGVDQVRLETADDLRNLASLDPKLWVALACPVAGLDVDERTMALIDTDGDGRVRIPEILGAVAFVCERLRDPTEILQEAPTLALASIAESTAEGKQTVVTARTILAARGKSGTQAIGVDDAVDTIAIYQGMQLNGDGIVTPAATEDEATRAAITDILATHGGEKDRTGEDGVSLEKVQAFFEACQKLVEHDDAMGAVIPFGAESTAAAYEAFHAIEAKVDDYFGRSRLAAFDPRAQTAVNRSETEYAELAAKDLSAGMAETEAFPLAHVTGHDPLPLRQGLNPAWSARVESLRARAIVPFLGMDVAVLDQGQWERLRAALAPYAAWKADAAGAEVAKLGVARVRELLSSGVREKLEALVAADLAKKPEADSIADVERLVRYRRDLGRVLRNFVNFADFYGRRKKAVFQVGTVYIDQRSCDLVLRVYDPARHALMAGRSGAFLAYFDCTRRSDGLTMTVCAAVTDGDSDNLMVGRNGLFYDLKGRDYDATITKLVDNAISLREAFWSPYKKLLRMIEDFVAKRAAAASAASDAKLATTATTVGSVGAAAPGSPAVPAPAIVPSKIDIGTVAALGVAVGGISAAIGAILGAFFSLGPWLPIGVFGLVFLISGPSMVVAALKLRARNIGPILDADGWALNTQARINVPFGRSLTKIRTLPPGSERDLSDPFAEEERRWPWVVAVLIAVIAVFAYLTWKDIIHPRTWLLNAPTMTAPAAPAPATTPAPASTPAPAPTPAAPAPAATPP